MTQACADFLLERSELPSRKASVCTRYYDCTLYLVDDVREAAIQKYGSEEALDALHQQKEEKRVLAQQKRVENAIKRVETAQRMATMKEKRIEACELRKAALLDYANEVGLETFLSETGARDFVVGDYLSDNRLHPKTTLSSIKKNFSKVMAVYTNTMKGHRRYIGQSFASGKAIEELVAQDESAAMKRQDINVHHICPCGSGKFCQGTGHPRYQVCHPCRLLHCNQCKNNTFDHACSRRLCKVCCFKSQSECSCHFPGIRLDSQVRAILQKVTPSGLSNTALMAQNIISIRDAMASGKSSVRIAYSSPRDINAYRQLLRLLGVWASTTWGMFEFVIPVSGPVFAWNFWVISTENPLHTHKSGSSLDKILGQLVGDSQISSYRYQNLQGVDRLWVHRRCKQLGLVSESFGGPFIKDLQVTKSDGWVMPVSHDAPSQFKKEDEQDHLSKREAKMAAWSRQCEHCDDELDAWSAYYHYSGAGPYCMECIEADPELDGYKWEAKAEFW